MRATTENVATQAVGYYQPMADESRYHPDVVDSKAVRPGYAPPPFYFKQTTKNGRIRWVAWPGNAARARTVFTALLRLMPEDVEVLLKLDKQDTGDGPAFTRYHGSADRDRLLEAIDGASDLSYRDGYTQLCVREPDSGEYVVLDEHGLIFVYSDAALVPPLAEHLTEQPTELINEGGAWRRRTPTANDQSRKFVRRLDLEQVE
jgi:hypothetical protein